MEKLLPDRHKNNDFFICDVFDSFKDDVASMEHPIFSLSKKPDFRLLEYENNGNTIKIKPSWTGLATIFDKDVLLYVISAMMRAKNNGKQVSKVVRFTSYDYLISTNKSTGGRSYALLKDALSRLKGTVIETNIEAGGLRVNEEFSLIDRWREIREDDNDDGRVIALEVELSSWMFNAVLGGGVLTIDRDYFRLRKPTERRLYELARKHCGNQKAWKIGLDKLRLKLGVTRPAYKLRFDLIKLAESNHLPEYNISIENDVVKFTRKTPPVAESGFKPGAVSKKDLEAVARPSETYADVSKRVNNKSIKEKKSKKEVIAELRKATGGSR